jgi:DNA-binding IclR family transcriptional regulator
MTKKTPNEEIEIKTSGLAFSIVEALHEMDGASVTDLAEQLGIAKSTVSRHLSSLQAMEYVVKQENIYHLGLRFLYFGETIRERQPHYDLIWPKVKYLAQETDERAQFFVEEHDYAVYLYTEGGENAVQTISCPGRRVPLHTTAGGKAILASFPEKRVHEIIVDQGLPPSTENTITDKSILLDELESIRERGFSTNNQESIKGVRAVGVAIETPKGSVVGAISIAGPTNRVKDKMMNKEYPDLLLGVANEIELNIMYP